MQFRIIAGGFAVETNVAIVMARLFLNVLAFPVSPSTCFFVLVTWVELRR
jgi:hypothetical protein